MFSQRSHNRLLVPILISTKAHSVKQEIRISKDNVLETICCNEYEIAKYITEVSLKFIQDEIIPDDWINSLYMPTPTIVEAAQALYLGHNVEDISRNDASAKNLNQTTKAINKIIDYSKAHNRKSICFITGVPGAGKTLAGLNIAVRKAENS